MKAVLIEELVVWVEDVVSLVVLIVAVLRKLKKIGAILDAELLFLGWFSSPVDRCLFLLFEVGVDVISM